MDRVVCWGIFHPAHQCGGRCVGVYLRGRSRRGRLFVRDLRLKETEGGVVLARRAVSMRDSVCAIDLDFPAQRAVRLALHIGS